jgi:hypothetical protein
MNTSQNNTRRQRGGKADVGDTSMLSPSSSSLAQGVDYKQLHMGQHGGKSLIGGAAPVESIGTTLPQELQGPAAVTSTMNAFNDIQGMSDQTGGARRGRRGTKRRGTKRRGTKRRGTKRRGTKRRGRVRVKLQTTAVVEVKCGRGTKRRGTKRSKRTYMGGGINNNPASSSAAGMILPPSVTEGGMNPEWKSVANDPQSLAPKMSGGEYKMYGGKYKGTKYRGARKLKK